MIGSPLLLDKERKVSLKCKIFCIIITKYLMKDPGWGTFLYELNGTMK